MEKGADINAANIMGMNSLMIACEFNRMDVMVSSNEEIDCILSAKSGSEASRYCTDSIS